MVSKKMGYTINPTVDETSNDGLIGFSKNLKQRGLDKAAASLMKFAREIKKQKGKNLKSQGYEKGFHIYKNGVEYQ